MVLSYAWLLKIVVSFICFSVIVFILFFKENHFQFRIFFFWIKYDILKLKSSMHSSDKISVLDSKDKKKLIQSLHGCVLSPFKQADFIPLGIYSCHVILGKAMLGLKCP